jgi:hypothetical protein
MGLWTESKVPSKVPRVTLLGGLWTCGGELSLVPDLELKPQTVSPKSTFPLLN